MRVYNSEHMVDHMVREYKQSDKMHRYSVFVYHYHLMRIYYVLVVANFIIAH